MPTVNSDSPSDFPRPHYLHELPAHTEEGLERLFNKLDINQDGRIDIQDLTMALSSTNVPKFNAKKFLEYSDLNQSGDISFAEFIHYVQEHEKKLFLVFKNLDANNDGKLDLQEIVGSFRNLGILLNIDEADLLLRRMDKDGTLKISFEEWRDFLLFHPSADLADILQFWRHSTILDFGEDMNVPDDFTPEEMKSGMWWRHLLAGGVAGGVSRTFTAPLDRVKVFLQVHSKQSIGSIEKCFKYMLKEGGVKSFWRGNGINVMKIAPETALKFAAYEKLKQVIKGNYNRELTIRERFCAGSLAGVFSQSVIYPLEVLKTRFALRKTGEFKSILDAVIQIYTREGPKSFYRGYVPNAIGIIPYAGIDLAVYESLKRYYLDQNTDKVDPGIIILLGCGTVSSTCGQIASYPLALVRTRLQAIKTPSADYGMIPVFRQIIQNEGVFGLYRGIAPNFMKVIPAVSISYVVYENCRKVLGVRMT